MKVPISWAFRRSHGWFWLNCTKLWTVSLFLPLPGFTSSSKIDPGAFSLAGYTNTRQVLLTRFAVIFLYLCRRSAELKAINHSISFPLNGSLLIHEIQIFFCFLAAWCREAACVFNPASLAWWQTIYRKMDKIIYFFNPALADAISSYWLLASVSVSHRYKSNSSLLLSDALVQPSSTCRSATVSNPHLCKSCQ